MGAALLLLPQSDSPHFTAFYSHCPLWPKSSSSSSIHPKHLILTSWTLTHSPSPYSASVLLWGIHWAGILQRHRVPDGLWRPLSEMDRFPRLCHAVSGPRAGRPQLLQEPRPRVQPLVFLQAKLWRHWLGLLRLPPGCEHRTWLSQDCGPLCVFYLLLNLHICHIWFSRCCSSGWQLVLWQWAGWGLPERAVGGGLWLPLDRQRRQCDLQAAGCGVGNSTTKINVQ